MSTEEMSTVSHNKLDKRDILRLFIQCYRDEPALWNMNLKEYSDKEKKMEGYYKLLELYQLIEKNATIEDVRKKINIMRTNYKRELKKVQLAKGDRVNTSWMFKEFSFLNDYYENPHLHNSHRRMSTNTQEDPLVWELNYDDDCPAYVASNESDSNETTNIAKRKKVSQSSKDNKIVTSNYVGNEENIIAKSWACKLSKLKENQRIWAEKFINDILTEGELGTLHRHFMTCQYLEMDDNPSYSGENERNCANRRSQSSSAYNLKLDTNAD